MDIQDWFAALLMTAITILVLCASYGLVREVNKDVSVSTSNNAHNVEVFRLQQS